jgi:bifunctional DNase/RNase
MSGSNGAGSEVKFRVLDVQSVLYDLNEAGPGIHFIESEAPHRYLVIPIALPEALALNAALSGVSGRRPGTHELMADILHRLHAEVVSARVVAESGGIYFGELELMTPRGRELVDCRVSDAVIIAMRQRVPAPVLCSEYILSERISESESK